MRISDWSSDGVLFRSIVQYFGELGVEVEVHRNDRITVDDVAAKNPRHMVLSPGPCTPNEAGICLALIHRLQGRFPLLGLCLGHQAIGQAFGCPGVRTRSVLHGQTPPIMLSGAGLSQWLPTRYQSTQYPSYVGEK